MALIPRNAGDVAAEYRAAVRSRTQELEVEYGDLHDGFINPVSRIVAAQQADIVRLSGRLTRSDPTGFTDQEAELAVLDEDIRRSEGGYAIGMARFERMSPPPRNLRILRGFPVATLGDEGLGPVTFVTSEDRTLYMAQAASSYDSVRQRYFLDVPIVAVNAGSEGNVGARRIKRMLRSSADFDSVWNPRPTTGGAPRETNAKLFERYRMSVVGRQLSTRLGVVRYVRDRFPNVIHSLAVGPASSLVTRAGDGAGVLDLFVVGEAEAQIGPEIHFTPPRGVVVPVYAPPLLSVVSAGPTTGGSEWVEGSDFEIVRDSSGLSGSTRARDGIRILRATGTETFQVTYLRDGLVAAVQAEFDVGDLADDGRDLLVRRAARVDFKVRGSLRAVGGVDSSAVFAQAETAIETFFAGKGLGEPVELSDLDAAVRLVAGIDNFRIDWLARSDAEQGAADRDVAENEYARLGSLSLSLY